MFFDFWDLEGLRLQTALGHLAIGQLEQVIQLLLQLAASRTKGPGRDLLYLRHEGKSVRGCHLDEYVCVCARVPTHAFEIGVVTP